MYVVGCPRSGSTALAIHKALEANIPFRGELAPMYILQGSEHRLNFKRTYHETGVQPDYSLSEYLMHWENINSPSSMYLLNIGSSPAMWGNASAYIARKNFRAMFVSSANYLLKNNPFPEERPVHLLRQQITFNAVGTCIFLKYCAEHQKEITWYEDIFDRETEYTFYNNYAHKEELDECIEGLVQELRPELLNQNIIV